MKKHKVRPRALSLQKETLQVLESRKLEQVGGGVETVTTCLTVKTCASFEFSC